MTNNKTNKIITKITTLDNGIRVALEPISHVRSTAFGIWVKNGTRNEQVHENGISHFIEHMMFKGTETRTATEIASEMDALGSQMNAYTTKEYTCYHTRTLDTNFYKALDVIADIFLNSNFDFLDVEKEKVVIKEEINMYDDSPDELVHDTLQNHLFRGSSLGMPILGTKETIETFTREQLLDYFYKNYHPENTVISVAGSFNESEMLTALNKYFGKWQNDEKYSPYNTHARYDVSHTSCERDTSQIHMCLGFPALARDDDYRYALGVFNTIFGGSMSSKLFQSVREERGLAYSIYSYPTAFSDVGAFNIYSAMNKEHLEKVMGIIAEEIYKVKENPLPQELVNKTKEQMISNYIIGAESTTNRMIATGSSLLLKDEILTQEEVIQKISDVGAEDIMSVCQRMFQIGDVSWCGVGDISNLEMETSAKNIFS